MNCFQRVHKGKSQACSSNEGFVTIQTLSRVFQNNIGCLHEEENGMKVTAILTKDFFSLQQTVVLVPCWSKTKNIERTVTSVFSAD